MVELHIRPCVFAHTKYALSKTCRINAGCLKSICIYLKSQNPFSSCFACNQTSSGRKCRKEHETDPIICCIKSDNGQTLKYRKGFVAVIIALDVKLETDCLETWKIEYHKDV